ncbi:MAG TPA: type II 3-dehydroquinate dehydratase [Rhizomicrobium sp.]
MAEKTAKHIKILPIYVLNGPNLNLLGSREPGVYGRTTLADIDLMVTERSKCHGYAAICRQSNHEGELVDWVQEACSQAIAVVLNAGGLSHTSIALLDACRTLDIPLVEVHLSNPFRREGFRRHSYISEAANGMVCGFGASSYVLAIEAVAMLLKGNVE